jgi:hypothetical protein
VELVGFIGGRLLGQLGNDRFRAAEQTLCRRIVVPSHQVFYKKSTDDFAPKVQGRLDDLAVPATDIVRQLPGVASVEQPLQPAKVTDRLVHLRDWHYVSKEWFAKDTGLTAGKPLTDTD